MTANSTGNHFLELRRVQVVMPLLLLPAIVMADAAPTTGTLLATAKIENGCRVVGQAQMTNGVDMGSLSFGTQPSIFASAITAQNQGPSGVLQVTCTGAVSIDVSISTGLHANGAQRQLGSGTHRVPYDLYIDSSFNTAFNGALARTLAVSATGATTTMNMPIYGRIQPSPGNYVAGVYQDTVQITVAW